MPIYIDLYIILHYQALYENKHGSADSLARAWSVVARDLGRIGCFLNAFNDVNSVC